MRALVALLLFAPMAVAQPEVVDWLIVEIAPFETAVKPLQSPVTTTMTTRASCLLAESALAQIVVTYSVVERPDWAAVLVSPANDAVSAQSCSGGYVTFETSLTVTANEQAPAFAPAAIVVEVVAGTDERQQTERGEVALTAAYFPILDVQLLESQAVVAPGGTHDFRVKVVNLGNAQTRVEATLISATEGIIVGLPSATTLGSRQAGASTHTQEIVFSAHTEARGGFVNEVGTIVARLVGSYALDPAEGSDEAVVSFLVTVRSGAAAAAEKSPVAAPALPLVLAALALTGILARSRR